MFIIDKDILQTLVQYLNQVDIANLMLTCKHYGFNPVFKDCLIKTKKFLSKKATIIEIPKTYMYIIAMFLKPYNKLTNTLYKIKHVHKLCIKINNVNSTTIIINASVLYECDNNTYIFNPSNTYLKKHFYFLNTYNKQLLYLIKFTDSTNVTYYIFKYFTFFPDIYPPQYFSNCLDSQSKNYKYIPEKDLVFNKYKINNKSFYYLNFYAVLEFNIKKCKNKIAYFILYKNCGYLGENESIMVTHENLFTFILYVNRNIMGKIEFY